MFPSPSFNNDQILANLVSSQPTPTSPCIIILKQIPDIIFHNKYFTMNFKRQGLFFNRSTILLSHLKN